MADATLQIGNGNWAVKPSLLLGYNVGVNGYNPIEMAVSRETSGSRTNSLGIIDYKDSNIARINYQNGIGSLLLEPQRTNLVTYSEDFSNNSWSKSFSSVISNTINSPNNTTTADSSIEDSSTNEHGILLTIPTITANTAYTYSVFVKNNGRNIRLSIRNTAFTSGIQRTFDLVNGALSSTSVIGTGTLVNSNIEAFSNGWYRCSISVIVDNSSTGLRVQSFLMQEGFPATNNYLGNGTSGIYIWGAQLEQGSYATSYIPTVASTVTRNADVISRNNIYTNGYITSAGGTWFVELNNNLSLISDATSAGLFLETSTNGFSNGFSVRGASSGRLRIYKNLTPSFTAIYITTTDTVKIAIKWNGATADVFANGIKVVSATPFTFTNMEFLNLQGKDVPKYIKSTALYSTPISDAECIALTTL